MCGEGAYVPVCGELEGVLYIAGNFVLHKSLIILLCIICNNYCVHVCANQTW